MNSAEFLLWLQERRGPVGDAVFFALSALGDTYAYLLVIPLLFWTRNRPFYLRLLLLLVTVGFLNSLLKELFQLPRPHVIDPRIVSVRHKAESGNGFPSGHAMSAACCWFYLAWQMRLVWFSALAITVTSLIGFSRLYLGCHWPADVLGGIAIGIAVALSMILVEARRARLSEPLRTLSVGGVVLATAGVLAGLSGVVGKPDGFHGAAILLGFYAGWLGGGSAKTPLTASGKLACCLVGPLGTYLLYRASKRITPLDPHLFLAVLGFASGLWIVWLVPRLMWQVASLRGPHAHAAPPLQASLSEPRG